MKYLKLQLPDNLHSSFKSKCAIEKIPMKEKIVELLEYYSDYKTPKGSQEELFNKEQKRKKK